MKLERLAQGAVAVGGVVAAVGMTGLGMDASRGELFEDASTSTNMLMMLGGAFASYAYAIWKLNSEVSEKYNEMRSAQVLLEDSGPKFIESNLLHQESITYPAQSNIPNLPNNYIRLV